MRILLSTHHRHDPNSGASGTTLTLGQAFRALGQEVSTLSFDDMPPMPERAANLAYPLRVALALGSPKEAEFDVIDASTGDTWLAGMRRRPGLKPLLVTRSHGLEHIFHHNTVEYERRHGERPSLKHRIYGGHWRLMEVRRSLRQADLVLTLNEEERLFAIDSLGVEADRTELVANPVGDQFLAAAAKVNPVGARGIAYVGAFRQMKGVEYGCAAAARILRDAPDATVSFIGVGPSAADTVLAAFPSEHRGRVRVVPTYRRHELPHLLKGSGILIFPSLSEGFGNVLVEAMACGLVPVAARSGGAQQIVEDEVNGLLVPRYAVDEMANAVMRLLQAADLRQRLQSQARESAQAYGLNGIACSTLDLYRAAIVRRASELASRARSHNRG